MHKFAFLFVLTALLGFAMPAVSAQEAVVVVVCSRGSVIPLWIDQIRKGNPITITEPKM